MTLPFDLHVKHTSQLSPLCHFFFSSFFSIPLFKGGATTANHLPPSNPPFWSSSLAPVNFSSSLTPSINLPFDLPTDLVPASFGSDSVHPYHENFFFHPCILSSTASKTFIYIFIYLFFIKTKKKKENDGHKAWSILELSPHVWPEKQQHCCESLCVRIEVNHQNTMSWTTRQPCGGENSNRSRMSPQVKSECHQTHRKVCSQLLHQSVTQTETRSRFFGSF